MKKISHSENSLQPDSLFGNMHHLYRMAKWLNLYSLLLAAIAAYLLSSCADPYYERQMTSEASEMANISFHSAQREDCAGEAVDLIAGKNTVIGTVAIYNTEDELYISFETTDGWYLELTHIYIGSPEGVPTNKKGNPKIGNFPYQQSHDRDSSFTYVFPLDQFDSCMLVAFHAEAVRVVDGEAVARETAWAAGEQFTEKGSWAMYLNYCKQECTQNCEEVAFDIFGGQDIPVGSLIVSNDDEFLYVTYDFTEGWSFGVTHLYVGSLEGLPTNNANTPIPGQFPYNVSHEEGTSSYTYAIPLEGLPSCYIIAAHAEAYLSIDGEVVQAETAWSFGTPFPNTNRWGWYSEYCSCF